jgi:hypothetical protein
VSERRIIRVFPRRIRSSTPTDPLAIIGRNPELFDYADEVHVSVSFTWDIPFAERLAKAWKYVAPVTIGGPAMGTVGGEFVPGMYLKNGYTITSRGCPERCWFCQAWQRDGDMARELTIRDGWNVLDDNLLACGEDHIRDVFAMLSRQKHAVSFTGGLQAERLKPWHVELMSKIRPRPTVFFAYDEDRDLEPLVLALRMMHGAGWTKASHRLRAYVLSGYHGDTIPEAQRRCEMALGLGCTPMAMLYRDKRGLEPSDDWRKWARQWIRPAIIHSKQRNAPRGGEVNHGH